MAEALSPWRLALIMAVAIVAMAGWLLVYNHLWDPPAGHRTPAGALGSSLDSEEAVRQATYSRRERERQAASPD